MGPLAMFAAWRALNASFLLLPSGLPETPCCPNRIVFSWPLLHALTTCDFVAWSGVRFGVLHFIGLFFSVLPGYFP